MNITKESVPEIPASPAAPTAPTPTDPPETEWIQRLAREFFSGSGSAASLPGARSTPFALPGVPGVASGAPGDGDLAGGYPHASAPSHPPVHPVIQPATPRAPASSGERLTPSGEHNPSDRDSYAFGEPRCEGASLPSSRTAAPAEKSGKSGVSNSVQPGTSVPAVPVGAADGGSNPEFYFLPGYRTPPVAAVPTERLAPVDPSAGASLSPLEIESIRRDFPALNQRVNGRPLVWLDNAATTHKPKAVIDATSHFYSRDNSNIHRAAHTLAARSTDLFERGREKVRQFVGAADVHEIVFTRGTTEAINLVANTYGRKHVSAGDEILLTRMEHHANIVPWQLLAQQTGAVIKVAPINDRGELILEEFAKLLTGRTRIVSVTHVSNALGTVNPVEEIIALAHGRGVPVLVDAAQSTPHLPVNVVAMDADFLVFSGHKVFGPTGIGALYGKSSHLESMPPWQGGGHMIRDVKFEETVYQNAPEKFEAGTPDIAGVVGLAAAIDYLQQIGIPALAAYEHSLLEYAIGAMSEITGLRFIGTSPHKASVLSFVIPGIPNTDIARHLDRHGIAVRAGHHCAQPAHRHFGLEGTVRPSLAFYNNHDDVDALVSALRTLPRGTSTAK